MMMRRICCVCFMLAGYCCAQAAVPTTQPLPLITIDGERFVADGKEFKIWGFNMGRGLFLSDVQLKEAVEQLEFLGVNTIRWHYADVTMWGDSRLADGTVNSVGLLAAEEPTSRRLVNVDRFWRMMDAFREKKIYLAVTLAVARQFMPGDVEILKTDAKDAREWSEAINKMRLELPQGSLLRASKYLPVFDERCAALRKEFATQLLTLKRPDTGEILARDPQLAFLNTVNEAHMQAAVTSDKVQDMLPPYFRDKLLNRWNDWLRQKYGNDEKLMAAWNEGGKKGLLPRESLDGGTVGLHPTDDERARFTQARRNDLNQFCVELDLAHHREIVEHCKSLGWDRPMVYSDFCWGNMEGTADYLIENGAEPYIEDHEYDDANGSLFGWSYLRLARYIGAPLPVEKRADRPQWSSEIHAGNGWVSDQRLLYPLLQVVYHSFRGRDGATYHAWDLSRKNYQLFAESMQEVEWCNIQRDISFLYSFRAAGNLMKSCEIPSLPHGDPRLARFAEDANIQTEQMLRDSSKGLFQVETEHFTALAASHPQKSIFKNVIIDLTSDTLNVVIVQKISPKVFEVTALGRSGGMKEGDTLLSLHPMEWVTGTVKFRNHTIKSVDFVDHTGKTYDTIPGGDVLHFEPGVRLYRVSLNE